MSKQTLIDTIVKGGEYKPTFWLPTPSDPVNEHLNGGGVPSNSFIQIQGKNESTFKSTFALEMLSIAQKMGLTVGIIDAEIAMDNDWARGIGVDTDQWLYTQPTSGESAWELCYEMIEEHDAKVVLLDSLDAMTPSVLTESEVGDAAIGSAARLHSKGVRKALPILAKHDAIIIAINHKKVNITQMGARGFSAGGGKAIGFYSKLILELSTGSANSKKESDIVPLNIYIEKNKLGRSYIPIKENVQQGVGIVKEYRQLKQLLKEGHMTKSGKGGWYRINDDAIAQGTENAVKWIRENKETVEKMLKENG